MCQIGERLKNERERLGLSQTEICALTGVSRKTQFNYESGERYPDAHYLEILLRAGADVMYILSGDRHELSGSPDSPINEEMLAQIVEGVELLLVKMKKTLPSDKKARVIIMLYKAFAANNQIDSITIRQMIELAA
ncbi:helix-turn-helix domain-containing protein [Salmonella enterica]|uniref:Helix-turn-helix domain-containing protein n=1 Tax=Salmonella enterica I TaxID=59201 RepID=A0A403QKG2_SALET|nr:transcriptional regulator [Salmonella enterica subsp. enterica serovar Kokomlemle]EEB7409775.1 helix-turn-helix domain-containing protein [Salmonella enterica]EGJ5834700.1 helix-turn-helix domain-containing protein [Salmonella enterica]MML55217.1 helix-turn-helix domain-containing protein [Salmonella enterica subsp. enterica serovar Kidderminster]